MLPNTCRNAAESKGCVNGLKNDNIDKFVQNQPAWTGPNSDIDCTKFACSCDGTDDIGSSKQVKTRKNIKQFCESMCMCAEQRGCPYSTTKGRSLCPRNSAQWKHTLVDPFVIGMNGAWIPKQAASEFENRSATGYKSPFYEWPVGYLNYDLDFDHYKETTNVFSDWKTVFAKANLSSVQATGYLLGEFIGLPASGVGGFSPWDEDRGTNIDAVANVAAATNARIVVQVDVPSVAEQFIGVFTAGGVAGMTFPDTSPEADVSPQQLRLTPDASVSLNPNISLQTRGYLYSHRRISRFTPQGMTSDRGYDIKGVRVYMHPLFDYVGGVNNADFFGCGFDCLIEIGEHVKTTKKFRMADIYADAYTNSDKITPPVAAPDPPAFTNRTLPDYLKIPFGASFINVHQAMVAYSVANIDQRVNSSSSFCNITSNFTPHAFVSRSNVNDAAPFFCASLTDDISTNACGACGLPPRQAKHYSWGEKCDKNAHLQCVDRCCTLTAYPADSHACYGKNWTDCSNSNNSFTTFGRRLFNDALGSYLTLDWTTRAGGIKDAVSSAPYWMGEHINTHNPPPPGEVYLNLSDTTMDPYTAKAKFAQCLLMAIHPCTAFTPQTFNGILNPWSVNTGPDSGISYDKHSDSTTCSSSPHPVANKAMVDALVMATVTGPVVNATTDCCPFLCRVHSRSTNDSFLFGRKDTCATICSSQWMQYLVPPIEVITEFASKWSVASVTGLGGGGTSTNRYHRTLGRRNKDTFSAMKITYAGVMKLLLENVTLGLLELDGRFNDQSITTSHKNKKHVLKSLGEVFAGIGLAWETGGLSLGVSIASITSDVKNGNPPFVYDESGVDETVCDLSVCDIGRSTQRNAASNSDDVAFRCVPRGYAVADFKVRGRRPKVVTTMGFVDGKPDDAVSIPEFVKGSGSTLKNFYGKWFTKNAFKKARFVNITDNQEYPFTFGIYRGAVKTWKKTTVDYTKAHTYSDGTPPQPEFAPTPRDAGYSQKLHDNNNHACTCDHEGIIMFTRLVQDRQELEIWLHLLTSAIGSYYDESVHKVVEVSLSWRFPSNTANIGLYMGGTSGATEFVDRDVIPLIRGHDPLSAVDTYNRFLAPEAPPINVAEQFVYSRVPNNVTPFVNITGNGTKMPPGLRNNTYVVENVVRVTSSCVRYPIGMLHRGEMSYDVADALYGSEQVKNFSADPDTKFTPTLQGYCETVVGRYRFCPHDPFSSASDRRTFCTTNPLAGSFMTGLRIDYRPLDNRCSYTHKICIIVPGSRGDPLSDDVAAQYDVNEGMISGHVSGEFSGYTILVTPFNKTTFQSVFSQRYASSMFDPDNATMGFMLLHPRNATKKKIPLNDRTYSGFGEDVPFFKLMSNIEKYLSESSPLDPVETVINVIDIALTSVFMHTPGTAKNGCTLGDYLVPDYDNDLPSARRCVSKELLFPPNPESGIVVVGSNISVRSATSRFPLSFARETPGSITCTRFIVDAPGLDLTATIDQTNCVPRADTFHRTPVRMIGTNVDNAIINVTVVGDNHDVVVAVLGSDIELFPVATNVSASNVSVVLHYASAVGSCSHSKCLPRKDKPNCCHIDVPPPSTCPSRTHVYCGPAPLRFDVACARAFGSLNILSNHSSNNVQVLLQGVYADNATSVLKLVGNHAACVDNYSLSSSSNCTFVNVTEFTSLFGYKFEHQLFRDGVRADAYAWVLLIFFSVVAVATAMLICLTNGRDPLAAVEQ